MDRRILDWKKKMIKPIRINDMIFMSKTVNLANDYFSRVIKVRKRESKKKMRCHFALENSGIVTSQVGEWGRRKEEKWEKERKKESKVFGELPMAPLECVGIRREQAERPGWWEENRNSSDAASERDTNEIYIVIFISTYILFMCMCIKGTYTLSFSCVDVSPSAVKYIRQKRVEINDVRGEEMAEKAKVSDLAYLHEFVYRYTGVHGVSSKKSFFSFASKEEGHCSLSRVPGRHSCTDL